jgi:hypothetical protein
VLDRSLLRPYVLYDNLVELCSSRLSNINPFKLFFQQGLKSLYCHRLEYLPQLSFEPVLKEIKRPVNPINVCLEVKDYGIQLVGDLVNKLGLGFGGAHRILYDCLQSFLEI